MKFKDYTVEQAPNGHLWVYENGKFVAHIGTSGWKSDEEICKVVKDFEALRELMLEHERRNSI